MPIRNIATRKTRAGPDPRHRANVNVVFCDGHVELLSPQEIGYVVEPDGSMPASDPHATNAWFSGSAADIDPPPIRKVAGPQSGGGH